MAATTNRQKQAKRRANKKDASLKKLHRDYVPRTHAEHIEAAKRIAAGGDLTIEDRMHISLGSEPADALSVLYMVPEKTIRRMQREPAHVNRGEAWTAQEMRLGRGLSTSGSVLEMIKEGI